VWWDRYHLPSGRPIPEVCKRMLCCLVRDYPAWYLEAPETERPLSIVHLTVHVDPACSKGTPPWFILRGGGHNQLYNILYWSPEIIQHIKIHNLKIFIICVINILYIFFFS
jgi:hypothetical protein